MPHCQRYLEEPWRTSTDASASSWFHPRKCHITAGAAAAFGGEKRAEWQCTFQKVKGFIFCKVFCLFVGWLVGWLFVCLSFFKLLVLEFGVLLERPKKMTVLGGFFYIKLAGVAEIHWKNWSRSYHMPWLDRLTNWVWRVLLNCDAVLRPQICQKTPADVCEK